MKYFYIVLISLVLTGCGEDVDNGPTAVCITGTLTDNRCWEAITEKRCIDESKGARYEWSEHESCKKAKWSWALEAAFGS